MTATSIGRPIRVLWLIKGLGPGGAERLLVSHARSTRDPRFSYSAAYTRPDKKQLVPELEAASVRVHRLGSNRLGLVQAAWALRRLILRERFDVVHTHSPLLAAIARLVSLSLGRLARPAVVTTEHNNWASFHMLTRLVNALTSPLDDATVAVSENVRRSFWARYRSQVQVVVHGLVRDDLPHTPSKSVHVRDSLGLQPSDVLAVTVANFRPEKAYPDLLQAASRAISSVANLHFAAVGQGPLEAAIRDLIDGLGIGPRFQLLGFREDVFDILAAADLFVLASRWEGFPIAVMEALAAGVPVVATRVGGLTEAVTPGEQGLLVRAGDVDALADAIIRLSTDSGLRARMAAAARERGQDFDMRRTVARIEQIYLEVLQRRGRL